MNEVIKDGFNKEVIGYFPLQKASKLTLSSESLNANRIFQISFILNKSLNNPKLKKLIQ